MTTRDEKTVLDVSDVKPATLRTDNIDPLITRLKEYRKFYTLNPVYVDHLRSRVGSFTDLTVRLEAAGRNVDVRRLWTAVETWAADWGVTIR